MHFFGLINGTLQQAAPRPGRPELPDCQRGNVVECVGGVLVVILTRGTFGDRRKDLQRNAAFDQTRYVNLPVGGAFGEIAVPQQAVCMPVAHDQGFMQGLGFGRHRIRVMGNDRIAPTLHIGRGEYEEGTDPDNDQTQQDQKATFDYAHLYSFRLNPT